MGRKVDVRFFENLGYFGVREVMRLVVEAFLGFSVYIFLILGK